MSKWHQAEDDEIEIDHGTKTVDIFVCSDNEGSIYTILTFDQIKELASKIENYDGAPRT